MSINRIRLRLTLGYAGIFTLTVLLLGVIAMIGFWQELVDQQDELLVQDARNQARNLLGSERRQNMTEGSGDLGWVAVKPDGRTIDEDPVAASLGLPSSELTRKVLQKNGVVTATIQGPKGDARVVSMPLRKSGEVIGVIQYAHSLRSVRDTITRFIFVLLPLGIGALGLAAIGGAYMAGRAVRPVRESFDRQRTFIADASHELKTPLALIRADTEVLRRGLKEPDDRQLADEVLDETDRMSRLISDLLLAARLDADKLPIERKGFDLAEVVSGTADRFESRAASKDVRLEIRVPGKLPAIGDPARTEQILAILLDNALAHTPPGCSVTVDARANGRSVEIIVSDTGPGISTEHLPRIFERFYRVGASESHADEGVGLGLSIARDLARAQGGDLEAENAEDRGLVFGFKLPQDK